LTVVSFFLPVNLLLQLSQAFAHALCSPENNDATTTHETIRRLAAEAQHLPLASQKILAAIAGVPELHFTVALQRMRPDDLNKLRARFAKMGV